jgi:hypothetical protein
MYQIKQYLLLIFIFISSFLFAQEKKTALLIGNEKYETGIELKLVSDDTELLCAELESCGFKVIKGINCNYDSMKYYIEEFLKSLDHSEVSLFFYSGQALNQNGKSYLIPVNVKTINENFENSLISYDELLRKIQDSGLNTNFVITETWRPSFYKNKVISSGVLDLPISDNTCLIYSAVPTSVGRSYCRPGVFIDQFIKSLQVSNYSHKDVIKNTRKKVWELTNKMQIVYSRDNLNDLFYFNK